MDLVVDKNILMTTSALLSKPRLMYMQTMTQQGLQEGKHVSSKRNP